MHVYMVMYTCMLFIIAVSRGSPPQTQMYARAKAHEPSNIRIQAGLLHSHENPIEKFGKWYICCCCVGWAAIFFKQSACDVEGPRGRARAALCTT